MAAAVALKSLSGKFEEKLMATLEFVLRSVRTRVGAIVTLNDWARWARIPHRGRPGTIVDGALIDLLLGLQTKAWEPETFRKPETVAELAADALAAARWTPADLDALILVTCTPFEHTLDQDGHRFGRMLGLRDDVPVQLMHAGCAGLARAAAHLARSTAQRALVLSWNSPGAFMQLPDGSPNALYTDNSVHPNGDQLWFSPALFSDGAGAATMERRTLAKGLSIYSRDACAFGDGPGFEDPLVVFPGGGALHPPGAPQTLGLSAYGMHGDPIRRYYAQGMLQNGRELELASPGWCTRVKRIYTHQASPRLVQDFLMRSGLPLQKVPSNCARLGNLVSVSTLRLLDEDVASGAVVPGDELCFSVVGAGPERGAFLMTYEPPDIF